MVISSKQNPAIKFAKSLAETKAIKQNKLCLVESKKVVIDLISQNKIDTVFFTEKNSGLFKSFSGKKYEISPEISHYLSETKTDDGVFGLAKICEPSTIKSSKILVLDNVQDPSNVGAIIRSAVAFNYTDIIMIGGAYPYTPKVIRSSMGHIFNVNIFSFNYANLVDFIRKNKYNLVKADLCGDNVSNFKPVLPIALVIGNEGNGISDEVKEICTGSVNIPMNNKVESLNASVSAGILMFEINNKLEK